MNLELVLLLIAAFLCCFEAAKRPHILFVLADDLGWDDVGFHGSPDCPTPHLDALAREGVMLSNYYVQPICTPTRSALMTGRYPIHTGMQRGVIVAASPYGLSLNETLMPQHLKKLGYDTHIVGKWHLGFFAREYTPTYRGFDSHYGYWNGMAGYFDHTSHEAGMWGLSFHRNMSNMNDEFGQYSTELFTKRAIDIINGHNDTEKPLFLYLAQQAVHSANPNAPLEAPWKYQQRVNHIQHKGRRMFAAMANALDESVGNVTRALADKGMLQDTIVVFSTDNGGPPAGFDYNYASNFPLRGIKASLWEGGVRGTGFVWSSRLKNPQTTSDQLLHVTDWLPTLISAVGGDATSLGSLDGMNAWSVFESGEKSPRKEILHNYLHTPKNRPEEGKSLRVGDWKIQYGLDETMNEWYAPESVTQGDMRKGPFAELFREQELSLRRILREARAKAGYDVEKLSSNDNRMIRVDCGPSPANRSTNCMAQQAPCLYHIPTDPCEYNNLADRYPQLVTELMQKLEKYGNSTVKPRNKGADPKANPDLHEGAWVPWVQLEDIAPADL